VARLPERMQSDDLLVRRWVPGDADELQRALAESADHLRPWMTWVVDEPLTLDERRALIGRWEREWREGGDVYLGAFVGGRVAGGGGLHRRGGPGVLHIGYWLHPAFLGRGLATEIARLLTDAAFTVPAITRVEIHHDKANLASNRVPLRLGYRLIGEHRDGAQAPAEAGIDCTWCITRDEWNAS